MKKISVVLLMLIMTFTMSMSVFAAPASEEFATSFGVDCDALYDNISLLATASGNGTVTKGDEADFGSGLKEYVMKGDTIADTHVIYDDNNEVHGIYVDYHAAASGLSGESDSYGMSVTYAYMGLLATQEGGVTSAGFLEKMQNAEYQEDIAKIQELLIGMTSDDLFGTVKSADLSNSKVCLKVEIDGTDVQFDMWFVPLS